VEEEKNARIYSRYFRDTALEADEVECWRERDGDTEVHFCAYFWLTIIDKRPAQERPE